LNNLPLVVDLDGTLLRSDLLVETGFLWLRQHPLRVPTLLSWLAKGKTILKRNLAESTSLEINELPFDQDVLRFIREQHAMGRRIILATASDMRLAQKIAEHIGIFEEVLGSHDGINLASEVKATALVERFGKHGFDYMGNSDADLAVFATARDAYVVNASDNVRRKARRLGNVKTELGCESASWSDWLQAIRIHQWVKNLLIFIPLFAAHRYHEWPLLGLSLLVFLCFSLCASSVYLLNDLFDLQDDRHHYLKKTRPLASGRIAIGKVVLLCPLLLMTSFGLALWQLPAIAVIGLASYYILTLFYSLWLKRLVMIDVITLAILYTSRLIVGAVALNIAMSFWLLAFSMFMFLSLALVKRYAELVQVRSSRRTFKARGRGYFADDLHMIASLGSASGYMAVMVLALYVNDNKITQLYKHPEFIWLACPLLLVWISRVWMLAHRGQMNEDPVTFAIRDRLSLVIIATVLCIFWFAI
jgi:4-hydroxybenzoate polyprenyltransferase/phosphoserine phosphatase